MRCLFQSFRVSKISSKNWYYQGFNGMATWIILQLYRLDLRSYENHRTNIWNMAWKKNSGLHGIWTHELCDTGAVLYQLSWQANWEPVITSSVVFRHNCDDRFYIRFFNRSTHIWFSYGYSHYSPLWRFIWIQFNPSWLVSSVGRTLHRYRRGHGFKSRTRLNLFQALFQLLVP